MPTLLICIVNIIFLSEQYDLFRRKNKRFKEQAYEAYSCKQHAQDDDKVLSMNC